MATEKTPSARILLRMIKVKIVFCGRNMNVTSCVQCDQQPTRPTTIKNVYKGNEWHVFEAHWWKCTDRHDGSHRAVPPVMALLPPPPYIHRR